ncbi:MAG: exodeoxyribonuclease V subunit gamma [Bacteroidales bacterium]|nr:exodeoxyribonuclease V subunit gamma [Bacteroidales bacterium]
MASALELILDFHEDDFTAEKVVSLLEHTRIKQKYGIDNCSYIRTVVNRANIRFGIENRIEDDSLYVSWKYGLEKILLGYAMLTDETFPSKEFPAGITLYPYRDAEASRSYDLFRLMAFVEQLQHIITAKKTCKSMAAWKTFLLDEVIDPMIFTDDAMPDDRSELESIYTALRFADQLAENNPVSFQVFMEELKSEVF